MEEANRCLVSIAGDREVLLKSSQGRGTVNHLNYVRRFSVQVKAARCGCGFYIWAGHGTGRAVCAVVVE